MPDEFFTGDPQVVTISVQLAPDPALIFEDVHLYQLNSNGTLGTDYGRFYDDGTHGDVLVGDGTFTAQVTVPGGSPADFVFVVSVPYIDRTCPVLSEAIRVSAVQPPDPTEVQGILSTIQSASSTLPSLVTTYGLDTARDMLLNMLKAEPNIADAGISEDGETIWIRFSNGLGGALLLNPPGTWGFPSTNTGLVFSPVSDLAETELVQVYSRLSQDTCVATDSIKRDTEVTVDFLKTLPQYGVISMATHGGFVSSDDLQTAACWLLASGSDVIFLSGEKASTVLDIPTSHLMDWVRCRLLIGNDGAWLIRPSFISYYASTQKYPNSLVLLSVCHSMDNNSLWNAFISNGAGTVFGWQRSVTVSFAAETKKNLLVQMIDNNKNTADAYAAVPHVDTDAGHDTPNATLQMAGRGDLQLPVNLVANGSFEIGDFTGWVTDSELGYTKVLTEDVTDGRFSGRIGRWDEPYLGGGQLNGPPVDGKEPLGEDFIYQDVRLPDTAMSLTLTFDYNVKTYDGAAYDYFDVTVSDLDTSTTIGRPVSHVGGIINGSIYNWGLYYTTGWQTVTFDLSQAKGHKVRLFFGVQQDGYGDQCTAYVDRVSINCQ